MKGYTKSGEAKGVFELEARFRQELEQAEQYAQQVRQAAAKSMHRRGLER